MVQRLLVPFKTPAAPDADETNIMADAATLEGLTTAAYTNTWNRLSAAVDPHAPVPLDLAQFPGCSVGHFTNMINVLGGGDNALKAATVGYVIEDQVSNSGAKPATAATQVVVGNARPDFVITRGARRGIVDITSSGQQGHVLNKDFNKGPFSYIGESTYQSLDFGALGGAAPALGGAAAALAQAAQRRHANEFVRSRLAQTISSIQLYRSGIKFANPPFYHASQALIDRIHDLPTPAGDWSPLIGQVDADFATMNAQLDADFQLPDLSRIIGIAQANYLVPGNPLW